MTLGHVGIAFYQVHLKVIDLNQRMQGLTEYELCQLDYDEFGMKMVKDMGCTVDINSLNLRALLLSLTAVKGALGLTQLAPIISNLLRVLNLSWGLCTASQGLYFYMYVMS